jgi:phosphonate utilization associated putative membrane protein
MSVSAGAIAVVAPALGWPVVFAVLFGALLHAGWNVLVKSGGDKSLDVALLAALAGVAALPVLLVVGLPDAASWPWLAASLAIHVGYYLTLGEAYRHGDFGVAYPLMRGSAPCLVALGSGIALGERLSPGQWLGVCAVAVGVALVGLSRARDALAHRRALAFAFANAAIIACYTVVDARGVRVSGNPLGYAMLHYVGGALPFPLLVWLRRGAAGREALLEYARRRWSIGLLGGVASLGSYSIALWAMTVAPVAAVASLRECSVLFGAILGTWLLGERFGARRVLGAAVIVAGAASLRLG